jgi:alpha-1,3/alpha-1,6-mannosyltransferase
LSSSGGCLKKAYRAPLNWLEQTTTGQADIVFVNSNFTAQVFRETFTRLQHLNPQVLYPSLNTENFDKAITGNIEEIIGHKLPDNHILFLSINRFERKKNLGLALQALRELRNILTELEWSKVYLIMVGGYDSRVNENREHYEEISLLVQSLKLKEKVSLIKSPSDKDKLSLLKACHCLIYTPSNEHFGIVPIEAMYMGRAVIAVNSGGPTETVVHGITGFLCPPTATDFASAMSQCLKEGTEELGKAGKLRVKKCFSFEAFTEKLNSFVTEVREKQN